MTDLERHVSRLLDEAIPHPPFELDATVLRVTAEAARRRRRIRFTSAVATTVLVAGIALGAIGLSGNTSRPDANPADHHPAALSNRELALRTERHVLAEVTVPRGSREIRDGAPYGLKEPQLQIGSDTYFVYTTRIWLVPGSLGTVLGYLRYHAPADTELSDQSFSGLGTSRTPTGIVFDLGRSWQRPDAYATPELQFAVRQVGHNVVLRADATAAFLPTRNADQHIPASTSSVTITQVTVSYGSSKRQHAITVSGTAGTTTARRLADDVNRLAVILPGPHGCPVIRETTTTTLRFTTGAGRRGVVVTSSSCGTMVVVGHGPTLGSSNGFETDLRDALR